MANFEILPLQRGCRRRKCVCWPLSRRAWTEPTSRLRTPLRPCRAARWRFCKITQIIILHIWKSQGRNSPAVFHGLLRVFHLEDSAVGRELRGGQVVLKKGPQNNYHGRCKSRLGIESKSDRNSTIEREISSGSIKYEPLFRSSSLFRRRNHAIDVKNSNSLNLRPEKRVVIHQRQYFVVNAKRSSLLICFQSPARRPNLLGKWRAAAGVVKKEAFCDVTNQWEATSALTNQSVTRNLNDVTETGPAKEMRALPTEMWSDLLWSWNTYAHHKILRIPMQLDHLWRHFGHPPLWV